MEALEVSASEMDWDLNLDLVLALELICTIDPWNMDAMEEISEREA